MPKHRDRNIDNPLAAEHDAMDESESVSPHEVDEAEASDSELLGIEAGADVDQVTPAELAAVHTDTETAQAINTSGQDETQNDAPAKANQKQKISKKTSASKSQSQPLTSPKAVRSQRYLKALAALDRFQSYEPAEAIRIAQETAKESKIDQAIEVHVRLQPAKGKKGGSENFRTVINLPHGTGKQPKVAILDEALIEKIAQVGDTDYDVLLATPALMPKVAKIAKILGPKGKMPNPKTGTVSEHPETVREAILSGRVELRADATGNLHQVIGRASWPLEKLVENFQVLRNALPARRLRAITVCATFGPGIKVVL